MSKEKRSRRNFSAEEKVKILREHLIERREVSDICDEYNIHPNMFYRWQKQFFDNGASAFARDESKKARRERDKMNELKGEVKHKDSVIVELLEKYTILKKNVGED